MEYNKCFSEADLARNFCGVSLLFTRRKTNKGDPHFPTSWIALSHYYLPGVTSVINSSRESYRDDNVHSIISSRTSLRRYTAVTRGPFKHRPGSRCRSFLAFFLLPPSLLPSYCLLITFLSPSYCFPFIFVLPSYILEAYRLFYFHEKSPLSSGQCEGQGRCPYHHIIAEMGVRHMQCNATGMTQHMLSKKELASNQKGGAGCLTRAN